jgi:hypothetical protein
MLRALMPIDNQLYDRLGARNVMREQRDASVSYAGYAIKPA